MRSIQYDKLNVCLSSAEKINKPFPIPLSSSGELIKPRSFPQSALLAKRKSDYYLEYINIINNPAMNPKYFTDIRYKALEKKKCDRCFGSGLNANSGQNLKINRENTSGQLKVCKCFGWY